MCVRARALFLTSLTACRHDANVQTSGRIRMYHSGDRGDVSPRREQHFIAKLRALRDPPKCFRSCASSPCGGNAAESRAVNVSPFPLPPLLRERGFRVSLPLHPPSSGNLPPVREIFPIRSTRRGLLSPSPPSPITYTRARTHARTWKSREMRKRWVARPVRIMSREEGYSGREIRRVREREERRGEGGREGV